MNRDTFSVAYRSGTFLDLWEISINMIFLLATIKECFCILNFPLFLPSGRNRVPYISKRTASMCSTLCTVITVLWDTINEKVCPIGGLHKNNDQ